MTLSKQKYLYDVVLIRPILVLLLVFYHAFAPYSGGWKPIAGFPEVPFYWWLDKFSYAFMLEMFVFVSGYVFGFQVRTKGEIKLEAKQLFWSKFKRLILPSMVFSLIYITIFQNIHQPVVKTIYDVVNGVGHMWFLPMLYWCFAAVWIIEKLKFKPIIVLPILFFVSLIPVHVLPFQLNSSLYYLFFFYCGYFFQRYEIPLEWFSKRVTAINLILIFVVSFPLLTLVKENVTSLGGGNFLIRGLCSVIGRLSQLIYSSVGIACMFSLALCFLNEKQHVPKRWVIDFGSLCMGVYLIQQFVLKAIYDFTVFPESLGPYILPWVGFATALVLSTILSYLLNKIKIGHLLIGG